MAPFFGADDFSGQLIPLVQMEVTGGILTSRTLFI
jgi:hypothetical protein